ncbi:hypothetical protein AVEN_212598-1 [Araneus ventricosus]|uniref:Uncharacterized protein n=1 Tax=Araneus ventricosus TaxID=182803 RepID=A0A4Y2R531_ARAVE|nr:hypothetical protein AVEN_212598-1 [Araneus ventricosus]
MISGTECKRTDDAVKIKPAGPTHARGFSNQTDDSDSDDEDAILANLKEKWKTVEGNGRITDDAALTDILKVDAEQLTASYPTDEEILRSLWTTLKTRKMTVIPEKEDVKQPKPHRTEMLQSFETIKKEVSKSKKMCPTLFLAHS